jgi:hypothetical protein
VTRTAHIAPQLWGVGRFRDADGRAHLWRLSNADIAADTRAAAAHLAALGIGVGDIAVVCGSQHEAAQLAPIERALRERGATFCCVDGSPLDAGRLAFHLRTMPVAAVVNVVDATLQGLVDAGADVALLARARVVVASLSAVDHLLAWGVRATPMAFLGPMLAVGCPAGMRLHFDPEAWEIDIDKCGLRVRSRPTRLDMLETYSEFAGTIQRDPCLCGRDGPSLALPTATEGRGEDHP